MEIGCKLIQSGPVPIFIVVVSSTSDFIRFSEIDLWQKFPDLFGNEILSYLFRAVSTDRFSDILINGVDVLPTDAVIYADCLEKALEYGGWPKTVMAFDPQFMKKAYKEVDSCIAEDDLIEIIKTYPTKITSEDGSKYTLTRLDRGDARATSGYDVNYGWWIPNDPWECLKMILIIARPSDDVLNIM